MCDSAERITNHTPTAPDQRGADELTPGPQPGQPTSDTPGGPRRKRYSMTFRGKFLFMNVRDIHDMIYVLEVKAAYLRLLRDRGVVLSEDCGPEDDYLDLVTDEPAVAEEFGFVDEFDDADEDAEESDALG